MIHCLTSWEAHLKHGDTYRLRRDFFDDLWFRRYGAHPKAIKKLSDKRFQPKPKIFRRRAELGHKGRMVKVGQAQERGGSWANHPRYCRSAYRNHNTPDNRNLGFRVVLAPQSLLTVRVGRRDSIERTLGVKTCSSDGIKTTPNPSQEGNLARASPENKPGDMSLVNLD